MNVPTAQQSVITPATSSTGIAPVATSATYQRIDEFIKAQFAKASSADFSGIKHSAQRAAQLGFKSSANSRYAEFLEAFQSTPHLATRYEKKYPQCVFLPWAAFHAVRRALGLWCDLPENYAGAVPEEQMPWMEVFTLEDEDMVRVVGDLGALLERKDTPFLSAVAHVLNLNYGHRWESHLDYHMDSRLVSYLSVRMTEQLIGNDRTRRALARYGRQMVESFFVIAPPEAFITKEDWITRFNKVVDEAETESKTPPNDPLVVRFVHGGALVVAAWGDEAAALNEITRSLNL